MLIASLVIGAHVATMHPPEDGPQLNDFNPGLYVRFDTEAVSGITLGAYRNSFRRPTFYAAKTWDFSEAGRYGLTLGFATGYQYHRIYGNQYCPQGRVPPCWWNYGNSNAVLRPLAALSVAFPEAKPYLFGATPRLSLLGMKKTVPTTHLSLEWAR